MSFMKAQSATSSAGSSRNSAKGQHHAGIPRRRTDRLSPLATVCTRRIPVNTGPRQRQRQQPCGQWKKLGPGFEEN